MESEQKKDNSRVTLAIILIVLGMVWLLQKTAPALEMIGIQIKNLFIPFRHLFMNWGNFLFSWQMVLIIIGLVLLAGKRSFGIVLIVLGGLFLAPKILIFPHITLSFILPAILIGAGIALIAKFI
ncbi:LiaF transmembrane domain-containing protein [Mariniphaga sp.]|uniref:LiaF transmembrane domain-containing protein n=1 Tax=Mariniphaga sp. TaxID=1954475 RepID=UPI00356A52D7